MIEGAWHITVLCLIFPAYKRAVSAAVGSSDEVNGVPNHSVACFVERGAAVKRLRNRTAGVATPITRNIGCNLAVGRPCAKGLNHSSGTKVLLSQEFND